MKLTDDEIRQAFAALGQSIPDGNLDRFSSKVGARLEVDMQGPDTVRTQTPPRAAPPVSPEREENSGLHEIKELATTAKKKIRRRRTTETEAQTSLLSSTASGLHAVVLPQPEVQRAEAPVAGFAATASAAAEPGARPERATHATKILIGAAVFVAIAATVVAVVVVTRGGDRVATGVQPTFGTEASLAGAPAGGAPVEPPAAEADLAVPVVVELDEDAAEDTAADVEVDQEVVALGEPRDDVRAPTANGTAPRDARRPRDEAAPPRAAPAPAREKPTREAAAAPARPGGDGESLSDMLDSVTGGLEEGAGKPAPEQPAARPTKKGLDRSDVSRAMGAVRNQAIACHDVESVVGTVSVRFSVQPSGEVTDVGATGSHRGTATGRCVEAAVRKARFPAFDGGPMTFTFPFLLAQ